MGLDTTHPPKDASYLGETAVNGEVDTVDVTAVLRPEEQDGLGNFIGGTGATGGYGIAGRFDILVHGLPGHAEAGVVAGGGHDSGADGIDPDATSLEVDGPGAGEGTNGGLGSAV